MIIVILLSKGCSGPSGPWKDLAEKYPAKGITDINFLSHQTVIFLSPNYKGSYTAINIFMSLQEDGLFFKRHFPNSLYFKPIKIQRSEITSCYHKKGTPNYLTSFWVNNAEVEIGLQYKDDTVINYCRDKKIDIVDKDSVRWNLVNTYKIIKE